MASGHALSVVINSCVSLPRNPKTRLAASFNERSLCDDEYEESDEECSRWENYPEAENECFSPRPSHNVAKAKPNVNVRLNTLNTNCNGPPNVSQMYTGKGTNLHWGEREADLLASFEADNINLSNEEFFDKLQEARKSHRENLKLLENAYNEKLATSDNRPNVRPMPKTSSGLYHTEGMQQLGGHELTFVGDHSLHHINDELEKMEKSKPSWSALTTPSLDRVRDMSFGKPPTGRSKNAWQKGSTSMTDSMRSSKAFNNEWSDITWTSDSDMEYNLHSHDRSNFGENSTNSTLSLSKQPDSPAVIVDNMWDGFSVERYIPGSCSESQASAANKTKSKKMEWSPKITIPKPFQMTVRDAEKEKKMSRASVQIDEEIKRRQIVEEVECQKQFKATPVPATTFIPLYEDLQERQMERSREIQLQSKQRLKEIQKPFGFMKREEKRTVAQSKNLTPPPKQSVTSKFKARKVPKAVFDPNVNERILEEEEYRKIRIKMRAEEMLRSSALPPNMEVHAKKYTDGHQRRKLIKKREKSAFLTDEHKFHPQINGTIPDYEEMYHKFQEEARLRKEEKEPTVVEPFNLRTSRIPSKREKILAELQAEEDRRKEEMRGLKSMRSSRSLTLSTSADDVLPIKTTSSSVLRKSLIDKALHERSVQEKHRDEAERQKKLGQKKLQMLVTKKAKAHDTSQSLESTSREKLKQFREAEKSRKEEYEKELQEMMERIESRPLLFERESQHNAQKRAERQYIDALRSAGLDEGFLERKGRPGVGKAADKPHSTYDDSDSSEDLAVLKVRSEDNDTYEVAQPSDGTFSSDEDD